MPPAPRPLHLFITHHYHYHYSLQYYRKEPTAYCTSWHLGSVRALVYRYRSMASDQITAGSSSPNSNRCSSSASLREVHFRASDTERRLNLNLGLGQQQNPRKRKDPHTTHHTYSTYKAQSVPRATCHVPRATCTCTCHVPPRSAIRAAP